MQTDGQLKTGRDVVIAALLGAEEFGFATAPLVVSGCIMMRVCHLDTCPVGVATQNPELRKRFDGRPEYVVNFMRFIAQEVREYLAELGFRTLAEAVGHAEVLDVDDAVRHWKTEGLDLSPIFAMPQLPPGTPRHRTKAQDHGLEKALDNTLIQLCEGALRSGDKVRLDLPCATSTARSARCSATSSPGVGRRGPARRHDRRHAHRLGRAELRRVRAARASPCG